MVKEKRVYSVIDYSPANIQKAHRLFAQYKLYTNKAINSRIKDLQYIDRDDLKSFVEERFWISCLRAREGECSQYLYQSTRLAALKFTSKAIKRYQADRLLYNTLRQT